MPRTKKTRKIQASETLMTARMLMHQNRRPRNESLKKVEDIEGGVGRIYPKYRRKPIVV